MNEEKLLRNNVNVKQLADICINEVIPQIGNKMLLQNIESIRSFLLTNNIDSNKLFSIQGSEFRDKLICHSDSKIKGGPANKLLHALKTRIHHSNYHWRSHLDPSTGKVFYELLKTFSRSYMNGKEVGHTQWDRPLVYDGDIEPHWIAYIDSKCGELYFEELDTRMIKWDKPNERPDKFYDRYHKW
eukprot:24380_1